MLANFLRKIAEQIENDTLETQDKEIVKKFFFDWYCEKLEEYIENTDKELTYEDMMKYFTISWIIFDQVI
jgi:hypothetical protein